MASFWRALVRCIAADTTDPAEAEEARDLLRLELQALAPPSGWEAEEAATIPGQLPTTGAPAHPTPTPPRPKPAPAPTPRRPAPAPVPRPRRLPRPHQGPVRIMKVVGVHDLHGYQLQDALGAAFGCLIDVPYFPTPYLRDWWDLTVPEDAWQRAAGTSTRISIPCGRTYPLEAFLLPRQSFSVFPTPEC